MSRPSQVYGSLAARLGVPRVALAALDAEIMAYDGSASADSPAFYIDRLVCAGCASAQRLRDAARDVCAAARASILSTQAAAVPSFAAQQVHILAAVERACPDVPRVRRRAVPLTVRVARFNRALVELCKNHLDGCPAKITHNIATLTLHIAHVEGALERDREALKTLLLACPPRGVRDEAVAAVRRLKGELALARYQLAILDDGFAQILRQICFMSERFLPMWDGSMPVCSTCSRAKG